MKVSAHFGGEGRDRTVDLLLAKQLLSQLSYIPIVYARLPLTIEPSCCVMNESAGPNPL